MEIITELVRRAALVLWILLVSLLTLAGLPVVQKVHARISSPALTSSAVGIGSAHGAQGWPAGCGRAAAIDSGSGVIGYNRAHEQRTNKTGMDDGQRSRPRSESHRPHGEPLRPQRADRTQRAGRRVMYHVGDVEALAGSLQVDLRPQHITRNDAGEQMVQYIRQREQADQEILNHFADFLRWMNASAE